MSRLWLAALLGLLPALPRAAPAAPEAKPAAAPAGPAQGGVYAYLTRDGAQSKVSIFSEEAAKVAVAQVEADVITLAQLTEAIGAAHGSLSEPRSAGKKDFSTILDRMIEVRLVAAEAREMGIDELPEVKEAVAAFREQAGQDLLKARVASKVTADPAEVERNYRNAVREWKVRSVLFAGEVDAKQYAPKLADPKTFDAVARQLVADKKAKGGDEAGFLPRAKMLPQVLAALERLKVGQVSPPVKVAEGFAVMKVEDVRYPEDPKARAEAQKLALERKQTAELQRYYDGLVKRWAKVDRALLKALDYHAKKPGLEALKKDPRVLARIEGGEPITVADLSKALEAGFFHGVDRAVKEKKVNEQKEDVFDGLLAKRIIPLQVRAEGIPGSPELARRVADYEMGLLFTKFLEKAVIPSIEVSDEQVKKFYAEHKADFMYPTFYKLESLAFGKLGDAEAAVKKLRAGTDFKWLAANADGQLKPGQRKLAIEGTLAATGMPAEVTAALAGAKKGDYRLHAGPESQFYAIHVIDVIGATAQPFDEVKDEIRKRLFGDAVAKGVQKWAGTLRQARTVQVFITRIGS